MFVYYVLEYPACAVCVGVAIVVRRQPMPSAMVELRCVSYNIGAREA